MYRGQIRAALCFVNGIGVCHYNVLLLRVFLRLLVVETRVLLEVKKHGKAHGKFDYTARHALVCGDGLLLFRRQFRMWLELQMVDFMPRQIRVTQ